MPPIQRPTPVAVSTTVTNIPLSQIDRAPAPVAVSTTVTNIPLSQIDRAPAPVTVAEDPGLEAGAAPSLSVTPVAEQPVDTSNVEVATNIVVSQPPYLAVDDEGSLVLSRTTVLNFTGNGVSVTANGSTANIVITAGAGSYGNSNVTTLLAGFGSNAISTTGNVTAGNLAVTGGSLTWANAGIVQTSASDLSITGDGQVTVRSLDGTYQWTFDNVGNLTAPGNIGTAATVTGGNLRTTGLISATGNITGNYFIGNGSQLTGIAANYGNSNVTALLGNLGSAPVSTTGNITAGRVNGNIAAPDGNGSVLINVNGIIGSAAGFSYDTAANALFAPTITGDGHPETGVNAFYAGVGGYTVLGSSVVVQLTSNVDGYSQINQQNINSGNLASGDYIITADNGTDSTYYLDIGLASSNHADPDFFGDTSTANDGYFYVTGVDQAGPSGGVGNLILGSTNGVIKLFVGNTAQANVIATVTSNGISINGAITSNSTIDIDNRASGNAADVRLYAADDILLQARDRTTGSTTEGGDINIYAGDSAEDGDASGGDIQIFAGDGGAANVDFGGSGGFITIRSGQGGSAIGDGVSSAESGGSLTLEAGDAGGNNGNIDRGAAGGDVFITAGDSTGNLDAGGDIVLTTGTGGSNAPAGNVRIIIPSSNVGAGGTWTFGHNGNLTLPVNGNIDSADGLSARLQALDEGIVKSSVLLNPNDGLTRLESWDNETSQGFTSADWSSAQYVDGGPAGQIAFVNAPSIINLVNSIETSRLFLQVNGGSFMPYQGYGSSGNNITFDVLTAPTTSPETVTSFTMAWSTRSRIEMDYDEGELNITARGLDININGDQDVDLQSSDRLRIENSSNVNGIAISTDTANTFRTWTFNVDGSLSLPSGANIANGALNGGTASATVALNAFSPAGNTVSIQAQGNTSSAVISIFSNAGPVTSNWTFTTAPLDPSESFLYVPNGGAISTPDATGGEGGKNIFIQAGASDPVTWNSNPGGELMLKGGYGSFGDGGGGAGGDVNIEGGASSDSHAGNVNISSGLNTWVFDYTGNLSLPPSGNIVGVTANNNGHIRWVGNSSGDGAGYTTLILVPDDTTESGDQYLIIDPTAPGHIHIRAGGTQDNSGADLFLGGENSYFRVAAGANAQTQITSNSNTWVFNTDGNLQVPGNINGDNSAPLVLDASSQGVGYISLPHSTFGGEKINIVNQFSLGNGIALTTNGGTWHFGNTSTMTFPVNSYANLVAITGARAFVNDANLAAAGNFGNQISGGGSNTVPVWSDGTNWYIG